MNNPKYSISASPYLSLCCIVFAFFCLATPALAQSTPKKYDLKKLAEGVYSFAWSEPFTNPVEGNSLFIINENDVLVVDACWWPSSAQLMIDELKKLTTKPVRYVISTHWHDDHVNGNFLYKKYWPGVEFIAHYNSRIDFVDQIVNKLPTILQRYKDEPAPFEKWLKDGKDSNGKALDSGRRNRIQSLVDFYSQAYAEYKKVDYNVLPDHLISDSLVLHRGNRVIKILWLGRGNTRGDIVVFLPKEKIVATGDLVVSPTPFAFGSYYKDWAQVLNRLEKLDANIYLPGHGLVQYDKSYIQQVRGLLIDLVNEVDKAVKEGLSLEETKKRVTLPEWRRKFAGEDAVKQQTFDNFFLAPAVERAWYQAKGDKKGE